MIKRELYMSRIRPFIGTDLIKVMTGIRRCGKSVMLELSDMLPPLKSPILKWGLPVQQLQRARFHRLSPRAPRFFCPVTGLFHSVRIRTYFSYVHSMRRASSRILMAAFKSRSIRFPHGQIQIRSDNFSSFFTAPHLQHFLLDGKKRSTFTRRFPCRRSLYSSISRNFPQLLSSTLFPKCMHRLIAFILMSSTAATSYRSAILRLSLWRKSFLWFRIFSWHNATRCLCRR